jgi:uncharacterized protein YcbX
MRVTLSGINRFPVKSCRGHAVRSATVERWGLGGDRRWMVIDDDGETRTAREFPRLILTEPTLNEDGSLDVRCADLPDLHVDVPAADSTVAVSVFGRGFRATEAAPDAHAWFGKLTGVSSRLVYLDDPTVRHPNPRYTRPDDVVSMADGYPVLLAAEESVAQLNDWIAAGSHPDEGPVPMIRFRPNLVVQGAPAFAEDGWRRLRIGAATFRAVKGCDRCVLTTIDPDTAEKGKEPIATMARHRRWDGATWFGMNLVPDSPGVGIHVGDQVEVLDAVDAPDGPPR